MMRILAHVPVGFLLLVWPMALMMSPMLFDAPGSTANRSATVMLMALVFYPALIGTAFYGLDWGFLGLSPRTFLGLSVAVPLMAFVVFGYPRIVVNAFRGVVSEGYFSNESAVYYDGRAIDGVDPSSFEQLGEFYSGYARDRTLVYFRGEPLTGADPASFAQVLAGTETTGYWRDAAHVFREGRVVERAEVATFTPFHTFGYAHDHRRVYYQGQIIEGADVTSFRLLGDNFGRDQSRIYFLGQPILPEANAATFELYEDANYGRDAAKVYALPNALVASAQAIVGADRETFTPLSRAYSRDAQRVYYAKANSVVVLAEADAATFEVTEWDDATKSEARDKHRCYLQGEVVGQR